MIYENNKKILGVTDIPLDKLENDLLKINQYVSGLKEFIINCPTPMSIAIQGDWGTGKTSIINFLIKEFEKDEFNVDALYFNTWQYSQFKMDESLYFSFLTYILKELTKFTNKDKKELKEAMFRIACSLRKIIVPKLDIVDPEKLKDFFIKQEELSESISNLKKEFEDAVKDFIDANKKDKLIIFIDDIDRLNPNVAIELLEVIKLFLDVPNCIFVLAIDYDVVVRGVKQKFGKEISMDKCRSYFDKLIQLPFRMPVESYTMEDMMGEYIGEVIIDTHIECLSDFARITVGANPRAFKRSVNSFLLIKNIKSESVKDKTTDMSMLFCALCIQISYPEIYTYLANKDEWCKVNSLYNEKFDLLDKELSDSMKNEIKQYIADKDKADDEIYWSNISYVFSKLGEVLNYISDGIKTEDFLNKFRQAISLTFVTNVTNVTKNISETSRSASTKIDTVVIAGEKIDVKNATDAIIKTFEIILNKYPDKVNQCLENILILKDNDNERKSAFRIISKLSINTKTIYLGTSISFQDKRRHTDKLAEICGLDKGMIKWYYVENPKPEYENN